MPPNEIRKKIRENQLEIERLFFSDYFLLNARISDLIDENKQLQKQCSHNFVDGICEYCGLSEDTFESY